MTVRVFLIIFSFFIGNYTFSCESPIEFPKPTGPYSVGYKDIEFTDENRIDPYSPEHYRKIKVTVYYPSNDASKLEPYGGDVLTLHQRKWEAKQQDSTITPEEYESIIDQIKCISVFKSKNAKPAADSFPVILFEHGLRGLSGSNQSLLLELVSYGYVVVAIEHPNIAGVVSFGDETQVFQSLQRQPS